jgi:hypothetical protein
MKLSSKKRKKSSIAYLDDFYSDDLESKESDSPHSPNS